MDDANPRAADDDLVLRALRLKETSMRIVPGDPTRAWMDATKLRFANRCLPLLIANQYGWDLLNDGRFTAAWNGGELPGDTVIEIGDPAPTEPPLAHFGSGIVTWKIPFLFQTPPGWNLLARGPVNAPKDGIAALEGIVESDWTYTPFTMNWKLTRPGHAVTFEPGEVICRIIPHRRAELQQFHASLRDIDEFPSTAENLRSWSAGRQAFVADPANLTEWQKHYFRGETHAGVQAPEHHTRLRLQPFTVPERERPD
jgi:Family of unknown function (DUF6065)